MISYDEDFDPPAPILPVTLSSVIEQNTRVNVSALIDTGADVSAIPLHLEETLQLYPFSRLQMEDARGYKEAVYTYEINISMTDRELHVMEVILLPFPFVVLGRDWLQNYYLLLNGPEQQFLMSEISIV